MITLQQNIFRPVYELRAMLMWATVAIMMPVLRVPAWYFFIIPCLVMLSIRYQQTLYTLRKRLAVSIQRLQFIPQDEMKIIGQNAINNEKAFYLGTGFIWSQQECEMANQFIGTPFDETKFIPKYLPKVIKDLITPRDTIPDKEAYGVSWIHGIGIEKEEPIYLRLSSIPGNVGISGMTGSGKTRMYAVLLSQMIQTDSAVIIIDPKGDKELKEMAEKFAKSYGRDFLFLHPAFPSKSIRFNPIKNFNVIADIGARLGSLIATEGDDAFTKFCELSVNRICYGLEMIGQRPTLRNIRHFVEVGVEHLFADCMAHICLPIYGTDWDSLMGTYMSKNQRLSRFEAMAEFYTNEHVPKHGNNDVMTGLVSMLYHNKEHYSKMILSLTPLLMTLCMGEIGKVLSPDYEDLEDTREIHNMESVILGKKVFYISLDSLSNPTIAKTLAATLIAEMATVAGSIYNYHGIGKYSTYLLVDEVSEVASEQLLQMLNKARGAGFKIFMAFQSLADYEAKMNSRAKAQQFLDNIGTWISLRVRLESSKYVSELFGETTIRKMNTSISTGSESESHALEFRASVSKSLKEENVPLVSPNLLMDLPNLQFFVKTSDGIVRKGKIPIVQ